MIRPADDGAWRDRSLLESTDGQVVWRFWRTPMPPICDADPDVWGDQA